MESITNWEEVKKEYVKYALEYGFAESHDDVVKFNIFYAKNEVDFKTQVLINDLGLLEEIIDELEEKNIIDEDLDVCDKEDIATEYCINNSEWWCNWCRTENYKFTGEGYYDFWDWSEDHCERIDEVIKMMQYYVREEAKKECEVQKKRISEEDIAKYLK